MTRHSRDWFYKFSARNGGELAQLSQELHNLVLNAWAEGETKMQIAAKTGLHPNTIRKIARQAREQADPRGFARMKPQIMASCDSVLELRNYQWFVKGLALELDLPYMQAESLINRVVDRVRKKAE